MPVNCGRRVTASDGAAGPTKWGFWRLHRPQAEGPAYFPETPYFSLNQHLYASAASNQASSIVYPSASGTIGAMAANFHGIDSREWGLPKLRQHFKQRVELRDGPGIADGANVGLGVQKFLFRASAKFGAGDRG